MAKHTYSFTHLLVFFVLLCSVSPAKYSGDTEEPYGAFFIDTPEELNAIGSDPCNWDDYLLLIADINMAGYTYTTAFIAPDINDEAGFQGTPFTGTFDGGGHTIYSFVVDDNDMGKEYLGVIGYLNIGGSIKNLNLVDVNISGSNGSNITGGLCGYNYYGTITNCTVTGQIKVETDSEPVGGVCGYNLGGTISDCNAETSISGGHMARMLGGICGTNFYGTISNCYATSTVSGYLYIGGLCGLNVRGLIDKCYSTSSAEGSSYIGSLCGSNHEATISDCYSNGPATGTDNLIGGLCGYNTDGTISNCYSTGSVTGASSFGGFCGDEEDGTFIGDYFLDTAGYDNGLGTPLTDAQMKQQSSFMGWDFNTPIWQICLGEYPHLAWQDKTCGSGEYSGGTGEANDPYLISTAADMQYLGADVNAWDKHFLIINDIDLSSYSGNQFNTIGLYDTAPFSGVFDGNGHTITGFTYEDPSGDNVGLFSYISGDSACIKNLGLLSPNVHGNENVGALAGRASGSKIYNCYVSEGTVQGYEKVGVMIGLSLSSEIVCCYSSGSALAQNYCAGGLIGACSGGVTSHCYSTASAQGLNAVGGLVGDAGSSSFSCDNCYAAGYVFAVYGGAGGLLDARLARTPVVYNCFWDYQTTGQDSSYGGGTKLSTVQMQDANNFQAQGWDFVGPSHGPSDLWAMPDAPGYPILWWQVEPVPEMPVFSGGSGQANDPYIIFSPSQLKNIGYNPRLMDAHFSLSNDVNLAAEPFYTIGRMQPSTKCFAYKGVFEGNNNTISNLSCPSDKRSQTGLFGFVLGETAKIKNLTLINVDVNAPSQDNVGALAGAIRDASIENCRLKNARVTGKDFVGGLVAINYQGRLYQCHGRDLEVSGNSAVGGLVCRNWPEGSEMINCSTEGNVSANEGAAGLVVTNYKGLVANSYADVNANALGDYAAGFAIDNWGGTTADCYSRGRVSGHQLVGGMFSSVSSDGSTVNCYTSCKVDGNEYTGGFTGLHDSGKYSACFWDSDINPDVNSISYIRDGNGIDISALSTTELQSRSTFTSAGWDFLGETENGRQDLWRMCIDGADYPYLFWQFSRYGDLVCPDNVNFLDYSVFAGQWKLQKLQYDLKFDGSINFYDWAHLANEWNGDYSQVQEFSSCWLAPSAHHAEISGDDVVDWLDLAQFCENWLRE